MPNWNELGMGAAANVANTAIGAGLGLMLEKHNDKRQLNQQAKLQAMQIAGQKDLTDYNTAKQMEMWRNTSYPAQMEMLKQAGLNPGLIYGMGGGSGQSTNIAQGNVTGADAPKGGGEAMGMGIQMANLQLIQAQKELIQAQTQKTAAETGAVAPTIEKTKAETTSITQGIQNQKAQEELTKVQTSIASIDETIKGKTQNAAIALIMTELQNATRTLQTLQNEGTISDKTVNTKIGIIKLELANKILEGQLIKATTGNVTEDTKKKAREIQNMIQENMRRWDSLSNENQQLELNQLKEAASSDESVRALLDHILIIPKAGK